MKTQEFIDGYPENCYLFSALLQMKSNALTVAKASQSVINDEHLKELAQVDKRWKLKNLIRS